MMTNSYLQIDLQALQENIEQIRRELGPAVKLIPVLKANAYGLGAVTLGRFLSDLGGSTVSRYPTWRKESNSGGWD